MKRSLCWCAPLLLLAALNGAASETVADRAALSVGVFTSRHSSPSMTGTLEYRNHTNLLPGDIYLNPMIGLLANTDGGLYGYGGFRLGFPLSSVWHWENGVGIGAYKRGTGPELYDPLEFCLSVSITRQILEKTRVGLQLFHISNAGLRDQDPGANSFLGLVELAF